MERMGDSGAGGCECVSARGMRAEIPASWRQLPRYLPIKSGESGCFLLR